MVALEVQHHPKRLDILIDEFGIESCYEETAGRFFGFGFLAKRCGGLGVVVIGVVFGMELMNGWDVLWRGGWGNVLGGGGGGGGGGVG